MKATISKAPNLVVYRNLCFEFHRICIYTNLMFPLFVTFGLYIPMHYQWKSIDSLIFKNELILEEKNSIQMKILMTLYVTWIEYWALMKFIFNWIGFRCSWIKFKYIEWNLISIPIQLNGICKSHFFSIEFDWNEMKSANWWRRYWKSPCEYVVREN
jgi:hypothetical protein